MLSVFVTDTCPNICFIKNMYTQLLSFWELDSDDDGSDGQSNSQHIEETTDVVTDTAKSTSLHHHFSTVTSKIPSYRELGPEKWLAAIKSMRSVKKVREYFSYCCVIAVNCIFCLQFCLKESFAEKGMVFFSYHQQTFFSFLFPQNVNMAFSTSKPSRVWKKV